MAQYLCPGLLYKRGAELNPKIWKVYAYIKSERVLLCDWAAMKIAAVNEEGPPLDDTICINDERVSDFSHRRYVSIPGAEPH